jgi:hypothetical protein
MTAGKISLCDRHKFGCVPALELKVLAAHAMCEDARECAANVAGDLLHDLYLSQKLLPTCLERAHPGWEDDFSNE